jgi:hypothetical protein
VKGIPETLVDRAFMSSLEKIYPKYWGPRLEDILANALKGVAVHLVWLAVLGVIFKKKIL